MVAAGSGLGLALGLLLGALRDGLRCLDRSPLARAVSGYIAAYWGARLLVQFFYFDRSEAPPGAFYKLAEVGLVVKPKRMFCSWHTPIGPWMRSVQRSTP